METIDKIAQAIRAVDGRRDKGASDVAEAILPLIAQARAEGYAQAIEDAAEASFRSLYPQNPQSDWTEFAKNRAGSAMTSRSSIRALKPEAGE